MSFHANDGDSVKIIETIRKIISHLLSIFMPFIFIIRPNSTCLVKTNAFDIEIGGLFRICNVASLLLITMTYTQ